ncbi:MAG: UDP-N-acetylmuramate dehydrogenase [Pseudobdellovibrionaceae bacterium]
MSLKIEQKVSLAPLTSWLVGGAADYFCLPQSVEELKEALQYAQKNSLPITVLGGGSNVLISDDGIRGLTIGLKNFREIKTQEIDGQLEIQCLSGTSKSDLLKVFLKYQLEPALFLAGIPGDVGGGIVMNAGVAENFKPREFCEVVAEFEVLKPDLQLQRYTNQQVEWSYRHSRGWEPGIITWVTLRWPLHQDPSVLDKVRQANKVRLSKQPLDMPSCGSVFINPTGHKAAQLIDSCGLKGFSMGGAQVSLKHANFIVNTGSATARELWSVIQHVKETVLREKNVELKTEVVLLGDWAKG